MDKVTEIRKEIEKDFEELIEESGTCLLCFTAKLKSNPFCALHAEAFAYKLRIKLVKDYENTVKALIRFQRNSSKLNKFVQYIMDEPRLQYIFTLKANRIKGWRFRASYERVKKKDYPKVDS